MKSERTDTANMPPPAMQPRHGTPVGTSALDSLPETFDEFPEGASEFTDEVSRRRFLSVMGASLALAGATGCNLRPASQRKIVPYTTQPDEITLGVPLFFATAAPLGGYGAGILVRSHEGRPIKIEGNPDHPSSLGGASLLSLASILDLYDPDRSRGVTHRGLANVYDAAIAALRKQLYDETGQARKTAKVRILTETVTSPTLAASIMKLLADFPEARWVQHDPIGQENIRAGTEKAFGRPLNVVYDFTKADVVVSLDADFLCHGPGQVRYSKDFASHRKVRRSPSDGKDADGMSRLYVIESMPSNTGSIADHRLALPAAQIESFARALAAELRVPGVPSAGELTEQVKAWIRPLANDLRPPASKGDFSGRERGSTLVVVGDHQPASLHALAHAINNHLGNLGQTVLLGPPVEVRPAGKVIDLKQLTDEMSRKQVDTLIILSCNPAYTAPADVPFAEQLKQVDFKFHLGTHQDETAVLCDWHIPEAHYLETWGDIRGHDGTVSIQQPLIAPLHHGKSALELIADLTSAVNRDGYEIVRSHWREQFNTQKRTGAFDITWQEWVRSGVVTGSVQKSQTPKLDGTKWTEGAAAAPGLPAATDLEINFRADPTLYDGRFANNGWLQECPKPLTRMTWDNAVYMSPDTASRHKLSKANFRWTGGEHGRAEVDVVELNYRGRKVVAPVWVLPGHPDNAVTVHLGHGRKRAGQMVASTPDEPNAAGEPIRGFNAYSLRTSDAQWFASGLTFAKTNKSYFLACVQGHFRTYQTDPITGLVMDRNPVRYGTLDDYRKDAAFAKVPPAAAKETHLINDNVPYPRAKGEHPVVEKTEEHSEEHKPGHDERLHPLTMYYPSDNLSPDLRESQKRRWAMAIDLTACTGCSACVMACVGENNTPVVGKYEVTRGRLMHWINIDRYYIGSIEKAETFETYFQPRMCVQCENAPCEVVCPVGATVHSTDGLNDMVYNRCVGTRYCSNNCPYKVRRFNFLTYADWSTDTLKLGRNPDVSVRSRGVMEKCTFCVQRIRGAEIVAEREHRKIRDGEILTACQAACPSDAIIFGDLNDPDSVVSRWKREPANYGLLAELNTRPRLTHLAALRNPNPAMPKGA